MFVAIFGPMKLEEIVAPVSFSESRRPFLVRDVLSHLLFLCQKDDPYRRYRQYSDFYRKVSIDFLTLHGFTEWEVKNASPNVVR